MLALRDRIQAEHDYVVPLRVGSAGGISTPHSVAAAFAMSLNGVSKHLKVLERAEIVRRRVDGREHWIRVDWDSLRLPYEWLYFHRNYWSKRLDSLNGNFTTENANDDE